LTSGKTDTALLEQFGIRKLAARRVLATDHPDQPEVGSDESLSGQLAVVFQDPQFLVGRIGKTKTRHSCISCQQPSLDRALQLGNLGAGQQLFSGVVVEVLNHADTLGQPPPPATPG
jgi:hypothetical protein